MPTAETTLIPASSINQRASKKTLTANARLDNKAKLRQAAFAAVAMALGYRAFANHRMANWYNPQLTEPTYN